MTAGSLPPRSDTPADLHQAPTRSSSRWSKYWSFLQLILSLSLTVAVLVWLLRAPAPTSPVETAPETGAADVVRAAGPRSIRIEAGSALEKKLHVATVQKVRLTAPVLTVTGTVAASLRPGSGKSSDYWQFNAPEILTAYSDWQKAGADIAFTESQLARIKELAETRVNAHKKVVERLRKLVAAGTDTEKDLAAEQTNLLQFQIQGQKEIHEAETAVRIAKRAEATYARQLQQAGLEPEMLRSATSDLDIVMADVPEGLLSRVKIGQSCEARFFGMPGQIFSGKVNGIAPVLSKERRSLRVLFVVNDPKDLLRPGMFAEIGLGTDARDALLIPADAVIHAGRSDYVLVGDSDPGAWQVMEVQVGEARGSDVEILEGLKPSQRVVGKGAILLKPAILRALQPAASNGAAKNSGAEGRP